MNFLKSPTFPNYYIILYTFEVLPHELLKKLKNKKN